ncbi:MAG: phosphate ABC transporter permease PstA [Candidatus Aquicultorales bacterium]
MRLPSKEFKRRMVRRRRRDSLFHLLVLASSVVGVVVLIGLLADILQKGIPWLSIDFLNNFPSRFPSRAGIKAALLGSLWVALLTAAFSFPVGVATAIFLEEYAPNNRIMRLIEINIANLAGVPSIVYGILGLAAFVRLLGLGRSVLAGALTMTLMTLPVVIITAREAIKSVPDSLRHASYGLGATKWQTIRRVVLPSAFSSILTGSILSTSRAIGETAPLIMIGALTFVAFVPSGPLDEFTVLPIQIFNWTAMPQEKFRGLAAAAIVVLMVLLLSMNAVAIWLRNRYEKRTKL